jgi:hypothetical protein
VYEAGSFAAAITNAAPGPVSGRGVARSKREPLAHRPLDNSSDGQATRCLGRPVELVKHRAPLRCPVLFEVSDEAIDEDHPAESNARSALPVGLTSEAPAKRPRVCVTVATTEGSGPQTRAPRSASHQPVEVPRAAWILRSEQIPEYQHQSGA